MAEYDHVFKIVLVGGCGVGKTSLVRQYTEGVFLNNEKTTIGVNFRLKTVQIGEQKIKMQIWDTAGQERFHSLCQSYYRGAQAAILVYDVTSQDSFDQLRKWAVEIAHYADENAVKILVGNKADMSSVRAVSQQQGVALCKERGMSYFLETSALEASNVERLFEHVAAILQHEAKVIQRLSAPQDTVKLHEDDGRQGRRRRDRVRQKCCGTKYE